MLREAGERQDLAEVARVLKDHREALREFETSTLAAVAQSLSEAAQTLSEAVERQERMLEVDREWLTAEEAAGWFGWKSVESFEKSDAPRCRLTPRVIRYHRDELREWAKRGTPRPNGSRPSKHPR